MIYELDPRLRRTATAKLDLNVSIRDFNYFAFNLLKYHLL